ncbi:MAG TPA: ATP-binding cassette domain-containing protein, partial [Candidatus Saccharimonadales bacterium]|nr:ATP-binding cassette domain-containing protein [Candidatus Saccharimonadales bacterium]
MSFITVRNLSRRYGDVVALRDVSFSIEAGEWIAITGPSGSGKSTLVNMLGCMDAPTAGEVVLNGQDIGKLTPAERAV